MKIVNDAKKKVLVINIAREPKKKGDMWESEQKVILPGGEITVDLRGEKTSVNIHSADVG